MSKGRKRGSKAARELRAYLIEKFGPVCQICIAWKREGAVTLIDLTVDGGPLSYSVDHIKAVADGGTNHRSNFQPAHRLCNEVKGSKVDNQRGRMPRMPRENISSRRSKRSRSALRYTSTSPNYREGSFA